jgi:hypothetical protein
MTLELNEEERQVTLLALAHLAVERPGWDDVLAAIAKRIDNVVADRPELYDNFRYLHGQCAGHAPPSAPQVKAAFYASK